MYYEVNCIHWDNRLSLCNKKPRILYVFRQKCCIPYDEPCRLQKIKAMTSPPPRARQPDQAPMSCSVYYRCGPDSIPISFSGHHRYDPDPPPQFKTMEP
ncbi:MAG: hypothetical protein GY928_01095 [Colwellia sp.]|nr:hypothetical protein [Colwellia sp.]